MFVLFLVYFPNKPPHPPTPSSAIERVHFLPGLRELFANKNVLLTTFAYSISQGVMGAWMGVVSKAFSLFYNSLLKHKNITKKYL